MPPSFLTTGITTSPISCFSYEYQQPPLLDPTNQYALRQLRQTGSVSDYHLQFETLSHRVLCMPATDHLECFISGLRDDIRSELRLLRPHPYFVSQAFHLAQQIEAKLLIPKPAVTANPFFAPTMKKVEANFLSPQTSNLASTICLATQRSVSGPCDSDPFVTVFRPLDEPNSSPCLEDGTTDTATEPVSEVTEVFKDPAPSPLMLDSFESVFSGPELAPLAVPGSSKASLDSVLGPSPSPKARKGVLTVTEQWFSYIERGTKSRLNHDKSPNVVVIEGETKPKNPPPPPPKPPDRATILPPPFVSPPPEPPDLDGVLGDLHRASFVSRTTTPWTFLRNLDLCVNTNFPFLKVCNMNFGHDPILSCTHVLNSFEMLEIFLGISLERMEYQPLHIPFLVLFDMAFRFVAHNSTVDDCATGIISSGPAFGKNDFRNFLSKCLKEHTFGSGLTFINSNQYYHSNARNLVHGHTSANANCSVINHRLVTAYAHFLYHSYSKSYLLDRDVHGLSSSLVLVDNYKCVTECNKGIEALEIFDLLQSTNCKAVVWPMNTIISVFCNMGEVVIMENWHDKFLCAFSVLVYMVVLLLPTPKISTVDMGWSRQIVSDTDTIFPSADHLVFGSASSGTSWPQRKESAMLRWNMKSNTPMKGCVFLDHLPAEKYGHSDGSIPLCGPEDPSQYLYTYRPGGFAISSSLVKVLEKVLYSCMQGYFHLSGSEAWAYSCLTAPGVEFTCAPGFHQVDLRGTIFGLVAAHPLSPIVFFYEQAAYTFLFSNGLHTIVNQQTQAIKVILGDRNLLELSGKDHSRVRGVLISFLTLDSLTRYVAIIDEAVRWHLILPPMKTYTSHTICSLLFGLESGEQIDEFLNSFPAMIEGIWLVPVNVPLRHYNNSILAGTRIQNMLQENMHKHKTEHEANSHQDLINFLLSMFDEAAIQAWSLHFKQWDPGGCFLLHFKGQYEFKASLEDETEFRKVYLYHNLEDKVVVDGWSNDTNMGPNQVTNGPAISNKPKTWRPSNLGKCQNGYLIVLSHTRTCTSNALGYLHFVIRFSPLCKFLFFLLDCLRSSLYTWHHMRVIRNRTLYIIAYE